MHNLSVKIKSMIMLCTKRNWTAVLNWWANDISVPRAEWVCTHPACNSSLSIHRSIHLTNPVVCVKLILHDTECHTRGVLKLGIVTILQVSVSSSTDGSTVFYPGGDTGDSFTFSDAEEDLNDSPPDTNKYGFKMKMDILKFYSKIYNNVVYLV